MLFQVLAAEINFGYKFQTVRTFLFHPCQVLLPGRVACMHACTPSTSGQAVALTLCGAYWAAAQARCETFNGTELRNLAQLAALVDKCEETYMRFGLEGGKWVILDRCTWGRTPLLIVLTWHHPGVDGPCTVMIMGCKGGMLWAMLLSMAGEGTSKC